MGCGWSLHHSESHPEEGPALPAKCFKPWACVPGTGLSSLVSEAVTTTTLKFLNTGPPQGQES